MTILTPVIFIVNKLAGFVLFLLHVDPNEKSTTITEHELRTYVDTSHEEGVIESEERQMINNVFDFGDSMAKDVMIPRIDMTFIQVDATYEELMEVFREDRFTRLPVYEDTTDTIIGINRRICFYMTVLMDSLFATSYEMRILPMNINVLLPLCWRCVSSPSILPSCWMNMALLPV